MSLVRKIDWRRVTRNALTSIAVPLMSVACVADPDFVTGGETQALLEAFEAQSLAIEEAKIEAERRTIRFLRVAPDPISGSPLLSVDLDQADLDTVLTQILLSPLVEFSGQRSKQGTRVSARFIDRPIIEAINTLLESTDLYVEWRTGMLRFQTGRPVQDQSRLDTGSSLEWGSTVSQEIVLQNLAALDVVEMISSLFPPDDDYEADGFTVGSLPELNAVYLSGTRAAVTRATRIIRQADRPVPHVIIEALVVNIDTSSVESIAINLSDGSAGKFDLTSLVPAQAGGNLVASFSDLAANSAAITASIDFLAAQNAVEIMARPYVATRSTKAATISIVDDQFARVDTSGDDSSIITTDSITAGISMEITPIVMGDGGIRVDINLEDSRFSATAGDIIIAKERSMATTSMIVQSGQTIVIGGLNSRYRLTDKSGFPWLRRVPLLNLLGGEQGSVESREELVVYLTPYIWVPGLDTPMPLPGRPAPELPTLLSVENGGRAVD
ncbi:MAG: hypothetical protein NXH70_12415 [Hyphomonas sp.]|nr:hypothetical protein [Hyphomonas sp.]